MGMARGHRVCVCAEGAICNRCTDVLNHNQQSQHWRLPQQCQSQFALLCEMSISGQDVCLCLCLRLECDPLFSQCSDIKLIGTEARHTSVPISVALDSSSPKKPRPLSEKRPTTEPC